MHSCTLVIHALPRGGAEKVILSLAAGLKARGLAVRLVLFGEEVHLDTAGIEIIKLGSSTKGLGRLAKILGVLKLIFKLRRELRRERGAIVSFGDQNNLIVAAACFLLPAKLFLSDRIYPPKGPLLGMAANKYLKILLSFVRDIFYRRANALVLPTEELREFYTHPNIRVIPNSVQTPELSKFSSQNKPVVLAAGRLVPQKRFDLAIEAFLKATKTGSNWGLKIFGSGPLRDELNSFLGGESSPRVSINEAISDLSSQMAEASIFVLSSDFEGFPNVLLEAMAHGLAVVSTRCPTGPSSLITDQVNGLLVPCGDVHKLSEAIDLLIRDPKLRRELGIKAAQTAQKYHPDKIIAEWHALISS